MMRSIAVKKPNRAQQVRTQQISGMVTPGAVFQAIKTLLTGGALSGNINAASQHTPVAFGVNNSGWRNTAPGSKGNTPAKGWNNGAVLTNAGGQPANQQPAYSRYALQHATNNPYAAGYSGAGYIQSASRGGVPLELQPNPLTVGRGAGQRARAR